MLAPRESVSSLRAGRTLHRIQRLPETLLDNRYDDIALFGPGIDIAVSLDDFFQGVGSIDDRCELSSLDQVRQIV